MKKTTIKKPELYFSSNKFEESLLIKFQYLELEKKFSLIIDYVDFNTPENIREFRMLTFHRVSQFTRKGRPKFLKESTLNFYSSEDNVRTHVIQNLDLVKSSKMLSIDIWFDTYLGGVNFDFEGVDELIRKGLGVQNQDSSYTYLDFETKKEFDFYNPFK